MSHLSFLSCPKPVGSTSKRLIILAFMTCFCFTVPIQAKQDNRMLVLNTRRLTETEPVSGNLKVVEETARLAPEKTAVVICDMWNKHWCKGATQRVAEMAGRMNEVVEELRRQGVLIIHAPSDTMDFYKDTPQRKLARNAPEVKMTIPSRVRPREPRLPIDDSDGGCDCTPKCEQGSPWTRQIETIEIHQADAITDSSEAYYLMKQRGITNVIIMGVHINMCVLQRPFGIRKSLSRGLNVFLMRDLTDSMYNPDKKPYCSHFQGTALVVQHIERYLCPTITSDQIIGGKPFRFKDDHDKIKKRLTPWGGSVDADYQHAPAQAIEKWMDMKFGLRIHWGPYCLVDGHESWILRRKSTPDMNALREEYQQLYKDWNPTQFDADEWLDVVKIGGCRYFTFTTKHHDGFSMFDTKTHVKRRFRYDDGHVGEIEDCDLAYSIMETPFSRDVVKELTDAARRRGVGIGLYFSHIDWYDADFRIDRWHWLSDKNYTRQSDPQGWKRMVLRHRTQISEILSKYGPINVVSLDMSMRSDFWPDMLETIKMARTIQPNAMFRKRGVEDYGDYSTPERTYGKGGTVRPWQVIYPCGSAFSYRTQDYADGKVHYKPKSWILNTLIDSASKGGNFQVAFGPMPNGKWPQETIEWLRYTGDWLKVNGQAIYKTRAWKYDSEGENIRFTRSKDNKYIYAIVTKWPGEKLQLRKLKPKKGSKIVMLGYKDLLGEKSLKWLDNEQDGLVIEIPESLQNPQNRPCVQAWVFRIQGLPRESVNK